MERSLRKIKAVPSDEAAVPSIHLHNLDRDTSVLIAQAQLVLAEKRTALAILRTALAILTIPLSLLSFLIATSHYYSFSDVPRLAIPLFFLLSVLICLGFYLLYKPILRIRHYDLLFSKLCGKINLPVE